MTRLPEGKILREPGALIKQAHEDGTPVIGPETVGFISTGTVSADVEIHEGDDRVISTQMEAEVHVPLTLVKPDPPFRLGSPELREHVAYMVQQCEFARKLDPVQRALWNGDHEKAARLMLAEVPADVIEILDGGDG